MGGAQKKKPGTEKVLVGTRLTTLSRKPVDCCLWIGDESVAQVRRVRELWSLRLPGEPEQQGAGLRSLHRTTPIKRELSRNRKLWIYPPSGLVSVAREREDRGPLGRNSKRK